MTKPMPLDAFRIRAPLTAARVVAGLAATIDAVADAATGSRRFLRFGWYAAALEAYGGQARTLLVEEDGRPVLALPLVARGPRWLGLAEVPGSYWPFRSFPLAQAAGAEVPAAALAALAGEVRALRIGPVPDGDPAAAPLIAAARTRGWAVLERPVAMSWVLDIAAQRADGQWPRGSTLRKNRFHEKHLAQHGALAWSFAAKDAWPATFDAMAAVEAASWIAARTDGGDAKFTAGGHGAFWRAAARDPVLAEMFHAALLTVDGRPAAFSFDVEAGGTTFAIANSYDPAYAKHSPGKLLYWRNLSRAADAGTRTIDWGAGDGGYKRVIGAAEGPMLRDRLLVRPGLLARLAPLLAPGWQRG